MILRGITVGDHCIVSAASVIARDVLDKSIVAGNSARFIRSCVTLGCFGRYLDADVTEPRLRESDASVGALSTHAFRALHDRRAWHERFALQHLQSGGKRGAGGAGDGDGILGADWGRTVWHPVYSMADPGLS